jgi:hypothetical protein
MENEKQVVVLIDDGWVRGVFDSEEDMLNQLREDFSEPDFTLDDLSNDGLLRYSTTTYYKGKSTIREEKINDILNGSEG